MLGRPGQEEVGHVKIWEQRKGESSKAYAAFCYYLHLAPTERSLEKAYQVYLSEKTGEYQKSNTKKVHGRWRAWSTKYEWVERAQAYDTHNQRTAMIQAAHKRQADVQKFVDTDFNISVAMQNLTSKKMAYYLKQPIEAVDEGALRQIGLTYDLSRRWLQELIGFCDDELDRLTEAALGENSIKLNIRTKTATAQNGFASLFGRLKHKIH